MVEQIGVAQMRTAWNGACVRFKFSAFLFALGVCLAFTACETVSTAVPTYHRVIEADLQGNWKVVWIAEGKVYSMDGGYQFNAVQRNVYNQPDMEFHYPLGRKVSVFSANLLVEPAEKPAWLDRLDSSQDSTMSQRKAERLEQAQPPGH
jgi:hypothetical protein